MKLLAKPNFKAKDQGIGLANDDVSHTWMIFALDKRNGRVIWTEKAYEACHEPNVTSRRRRLTRLQ